MNTGTESGRRIKAFIAVRLKILLHFFNNTGIRIKLSIAFLLLCVMPVAISGTLLLTRAGNLAQKQAEEGAVLALNQMAQNIDSLIQGYIDISNSILFDTSISRQIFQRYNSVNEALELYHGWWTRRNDILKLRPELLGMTIYTNNPTLPDAHPYLLKLDSGLMKREDFQPVLEAGSAPYWGPVKEVPYRIEYWAEPQEKSYNMRRVFSLNRTFFQTNKTGATGILTLEISENVLYRLIELEGRNKDVFIIDHNNRVLTASDRKHIDNPSAMIFDDAGLQKDSPDASGSNTDSRIWQHRLSNGWNLVVALNLAEIRSQADRLRSFGLAVIILAALTASGMVLLISILLTRRIRHLLHKIRNIDYLLLDPGPSIEGDDEVGQLDKSFNEMTKNLKKSIEQAYALQLEKNKAEIEVLQARINPHFLYNALSAIGWMTESCPPEEVRRALSHLSSFYRVNLSGGEEIIPLEEELNGLASYIEIRKLRSPGRVRIFFDIDEAVKPVLIPKMTLQPIVENCIEHGASDVRPVVNVIIRGRLCGKDVVINIEDDGAGIEPDRLEEIRRGALKSRYRGGYGYKNVNQRLIMHFGEAYGLEISSTLGEGTTVTVRIPWSE